MRNSLLASALIHFGFFFFIIQLRPVSSPRPEVVEVSLPSPTQGVRREIQVIPKGDSDVTGKKCEHTYGGIGIESGPFDVITKIFEGYAADRAGLHVGDVMFYSGYIRGEPGTIVHIRFKRGSQYLNIDIMREKVCYD